MLFRGEYYFLSNMYPTPVTVTVGERTLTFDNAEAAFQAGKCPERAEEFVGLEGALSKKLGRHVRLRTDWEDVKLHWMSTVLLAKFSDMELRQKLLDTGTQELVEDNHWNDTYWGRCNGVGENHLGQILMRIRQMAQEVVK